MASVIATETLPVANNIPNKRERVASQYGQINDLVAASWSASTGTPAQMKDAINRLAAALVALLAKLDADAGVTDTNYTSLLKP